MDDINDISDSIVRLRKLISLFCYKIKWLRNLMNLFSLVFCFYRGTISRLQISQGKLIILVLLQKKKLTFRNNIF